MAKFAYAYFGHHSSPLNRALPLGRLTKRTPTHTPVPPNPAVEPLAVSFLNSFFCYELIFFKVWRRIGKSRRSRWCTRLDQRYPLPRV